MQIKTKMRYYLTPVGMVIIEKTRHNNMLEKIWRKREKVEAVQILFSWVPKSLWTVTAAMKLKDDQPRQHIKKQKRYFAYKGPSS